MKATAEKSGGRAVQWLLAVFLAVGSTCVVGARVARGDEEALAEADDYDPWRPFNERMFALNHDILDRYALTLAVLAVAFWRLGMPVLVLGTLAVSLRWSLGIVTLVIAHLSIFSVMFISIVVGLGTDYGVYLLLRNEEEIGLGRSPREALEVTAMRAGPGMLSGSLTAAGTFYALMATDFPGIRELGFIAGTSILLAWLSMMTLLPAPP